MKQPVDNTLIRRIKKNGCNESYKLLSNRHEKLFYKICQNYIPIAMSKGIRKNDVLENKDFVIFKAILSYKNNKKCKFSTWLGNCTKYYCLTLINKDNRMVSSEEDILKLTINNQIKEEHSDEERNKNDKEYIFNILKNLKDQRIYKVFKLRYFEDFKEKKKPTWSFIAKKIKTSTQTAINLHERGKEILKKKLDSIYYQDIV